jgi:REP element-mobilizing transposase RayT
LDSPAAHRKLLEIIRYYILGYSCEAAGFSIMGNHYHLMVRFEAFRQLSQEELEEKAKYFYPRPEQTAHWTQSHWERFNRRLFDVSELMRNIQMVYAKWHNRRFGRRGSFWEGRFKSTLLLDLAAIQECLLYVELNPVRAGLAQRPEQWSRSSAHLRDCKEDRWLLSLAEVFPEVPLGQVDQHYRARLFYRGALDKESGGKVISEQVLREEEARAFCSRGLYLKRLRYFTDGLALGSQEDVREWISRLRRQGRYLRRRHPILHGGLTCLREQRSLALDVVT